MSNDDRATSRKAWAIGIGGLLAYEVYTLVNAREHDTLSETMWSMMRRPLIPFAIGALISHFVWQADYVYDDYGKGEK